ncbi:hypothetical protein AI27_03030 [Sphingomonas sp. BHC-A]|nr:hypothetical protein [Sphingobium indicum]APL95563.1 hypothetical protein SIDU_14150 [Sphingobium indicum B90A]KEZ00657.1 hypothetical protein AI27_03030 [Sphingomonas sp. BHC-A]
MKRIEANKLLKPMSYIGGAISEWRLLQQLEGHIAPAAIPFETRVGFMKSVELLKEAASDLSMRTSLGVIEAEWDDAFAQIAVNRPLSAHELQRLANYGERVSTVFATEACSLALMTLAPGHAAYAAPERPLFGEQVEEAFPTASAEIADAGRCRAAGLWTACVTHLMRALEPALGALAAWVGVTPKANWNATLNQIEARLREIHKGVDGDEAERWASEAALQLRAVKNAWRNHAMHGRTRYEEDDAVRVFDSTKYLMQTLAGRLTE